MKTISPETVEETWQKIAEMDPETAGTAMFAFSESQPNLLGFVMAFSEELETDAAELSMYMLYVVYQMFADSAKSDIPIVTDEQIETQYQSICDLLEKVHESDGDPEAAGVEAQLDNQPHVYQYVSEVLLEENEDPEEQMNISEEEVGEIFMMMKCVIDVVDSVTN